MKAKWLGAVAALAMTCAGMGERAEAASARISAQLESTADEVTNVSFDFTDGSNLTFLHFDYQQFVGSSSGPNNISWSINDPNASIALGTASVSGDGSAIRSFSIFDPDYRYDILYEFFLGQQPDYSTSVTGFSLNYDLSRDNFGNYFLTGGISNSSIRSIDIQGAPFDSIPSPVPIPGALPLFGAGILALGGATVVTRRRQRSAAQAA